MDSKKEQQRLLREPSFSDGTSSRDSSEISEKAYVRRQSDRYLRTTARRLKQTTCWLYLLAATYMLTVVVFALLYVRLKNNYKECRRLDLFPCTNLISPILSLLAMVRKSTLSHRALTNKSSQLSQRIPASSSSNA